MRLCWFILDISDMTALSVGARSTQQLNYTNCRIDLCSVCTHLFC